MTRISDEDAGAKLAEVALNVLRVQPKNRVRRRLELLLNDDMIGVAGAQKVYRDAFGDELIAVKDTPPTPPPVLKRRRSFWDLISRKSDS
jgi:hypothetical protein